jgi:hypothetical protein
MPVTIFFSWQSDTPTIGGRNLIDRALRRAASKVAEDATIDPALRDDLSIDRDTQGVAGQVPIVDTILRKIDAAALFVPDLTFIAKRPDGRPTPNPNVLIEYGWALKSLGHARIIPVMNSAFGPPTRESMPFDMGHLKFPITYHCPADASDEARRGAREDLAKKVEAAIRGCLASPEYRATLSSPPPPPPFEPRDTRDGPARFRLSGEPLGVRDRGEQRQLLLTGGAAMWLRVLPRGHLGRGWKVSELQEAITSSGPVLPLNASVGSYGYLRREDGFGIYEDLSGKGIVSSILYLFTTGEIWTIDTYEIQSRANLVILREDSFKDALVQCAGTLRRLGIEPPYNWIAGMEGVQGRYLGVVGMQMREPGFGPCSVPLIQSEGGYSPPESAADALRPFFETVFESFATDRPASLG